MARAFNQTRGLPVPEQLDLLRQMFDCPTSDGETPDSTDPPGTTAAIETHARDPTEVSNREILTQSQTLLANALYCKSRALASKPKISED